MKWYKHRNKKTIDENPKFTLKKCPSCKGLLYHLGKLYYCFDCKFYGVENEYKIF